MTTTTPTTTKGPPHTGGGGFPCTSDCSACEAEDLQAEAEALRARMECRRQFTAETEQRFGKPLADLTRDEMRAVQDEQMQKVRVAYCGYDVISDAWVAKGERGE